MSLRKANNIDTEIKRRDSASVVFVTYLCQTCCTTGPDIDKEPAAQKTPEPKCLSVLAGQLEDRLVGRDPRTRRHKRSPTLLCRVRPGQLQDTVKCRHFSRVCEVLVSQSTRVTSGTVMIALTQGLNALIYGGEQLEGVKVNL